MDISKPKSPSPPPPNPTGATVTIPARKKPGPKPWATPELWAFLETGIPDYRSAQAVKGKTSAIDTFLNDFMPKFWVVHPIAGTRTAASDRTRVKQWFQNHGNKKVETVVRISDIFAKPKTRALKAEEVYSRLYYQDRIKPVVDERKAGVSSRAEVLRIIKDTTKELFNAESPEVRAEVSAWMKEQVVSTTAEHDDETITPEMFAVALGAAPGQIKAFNKALSKATGCAVMTILGGPDPWENGKIATYGFHAGEDKHGRTFGQAFPNFKETYLTPFTRFLREVYPADVRLARALKQDEDAPGKSSQDGVGSSSKPVPDDGDVVNGEQVDEEIVMESASKTNGTEGHKAADDIDVEGESRRASEGQQSIEPLPSPIDPPPSPRVPEDKDQIPPPSPSPELDRDINDAREPVEIEGAGPADGDDASGRLPEDRDGNDRQPSEEMPSGDASSQIPPGDIINPTVEPPTDEPTGAKSRKRQCSQAKVTESLVSTRPKRARAGPASKEILTLAEWAGLAGDIRAPNVPKKHRARKT